MRSFAEQIETLVAQGYGQATAQARVAHDAVLLAMDVCGFKRHSTVKGGVVMSHVTNDIRRTTMDMDIAFVHRSISDASIVRFVRKLNCLPKVRISMFGTIGELLHEDYRGKRLYLDVTDGSIPTPIRMESLGPGPTEALKNGSFAGLVPESSCPRKLFRPRLRRSSVVSILPSVPSSRGYSRKHTDLSDKQ